jgi:hypothetical protein
MTAETKLKQRYYSNKKFKTNLDKYYSDDKKINKMLDVLKEDLKKGFYLFTKRNLERFILNKDITDFALQFIRLEHYYNSHNKYSNTNELYKIFYGTELGNLRWNEKIDKMKGDKNPGFNHGGRLSPWKKGSINYSEESLKKAQENRSYTTRLSYYQDKGYSDEEAGLLLKERQTTFSMKKCIEKFGEDEGLLVFNKRQEKWQNTLKAKSPEEIDDINKRKSSGIGRYLDRNIAGNLYYIHFFSNEFDFWKVGITSKNIEERFNFDVLVHKHQIYYELLIFKECKNIQDAYKEEQYILSKFFKNRIIIDIEGFYTTEAFNIDVLEGVYDEII